MAIQIRKAAPIGPAIVAAVNSLRATVAASASKFHCDVTSASTTGDFTSPAAGAALTSTVANASDLPTSIALANDLKAKINVHFADALAHLAADSTNGPIATANASDLTTVQALANELKTKLTAHYTQSGVHATNDGTNTIAAANATDQASSNTLLNAIKTAFNAHIVSAPAGSSISLIDA